MKLKTIPKGNYCYKYNGKNGKKKSGLPFMGIDVCPNYSYKYIDGVPVPYCKLLKSMGMPDCNNKDWGKIVKHFGSKEKAFEAMEYSLLWDMVKECGENK